MAVNIDLHTDGDEGLKISARSYSTDDTDEFHKFTAVELRVKGGQVRMFLTDIKDVDNLAFTFETLARQLREQYPSIAEGAKK
jgi:hypothetical protein